MKVTADIHPQPIEQTTIRHPQPTVQTNRDGFVELPQRVQSTSDYGRTHGDTTGGGHGLYRGTQQIREPPNENMIQNGSNTGFYSENFEV